MVCNNCGKVFPSDQINVITGGCNPIPLDKTISGGQLTITTDSLHAGRPVLLIPTLTGPRSERMRLRTVAFSNLRRRKSRAAFLVAGLLVGIGTVVALLTLSQALTVQAQNNLETYGANIIVAPRTDGLSLTYGGVTLGAVSVGRAGHPRRPTWRASRRSPTAGTSPSSRPSCSAPSASGAGRACSWACSPRTSSTSRSGGAWTGGRRGNGHEIVAGSAAAAALKLRTGAVVSVDGRPFTVTGILRPTGSQDDDLLITDLGTAQGVLDKPGKVSMIQIAALCSNCPVEKIVAQLGGVLPGTKVTAMQDKVKNRMHAIDQFRAFSWIVAGVIIGIEALVVFVTMMGSVNERTREIGIFRALGFRRLHVTGLILIEAAVASLLAGVLGYLAGMGVSYALLPLLAGDGVSVDVDAGAGRRGRRPRRPHRRRRLAVPGAPRQPHGPDRRAAGALRRVRDPPHRRPQQPAPPQGRAPRSSSPASSSASAPWWRSSRSPQSMTGQTKANLQSFGANIVVTPRSQGRDPQLRRHLRRRRLRRAAVAVARPTWRASTPSRAAPTSPWSRRSWSARSRSRATASCCWACGRQQQFKLKRWWSVGRRARADQRPRAHRRRRGRADARPHMGDYVRIGGRRFTVTGVLRETGSQDDSLLIVDLGAVQQVLRPAGQADAHRDRGAVRRRARRQDRRRDRRRPAAGQGHGHAGGGQEPPARRRPVPPLQLRDRRRGHRHRGARGVHHRDGLGQRAHARDRRVPRHRLPAGAHHAADPDRGGRRQHRSPACSATRPAWRSPTSCCRWSPHSAEVAWTPLLGLAAVVLAVAIGGLASLYPALHAGKMDPTEALRAL